MEINNKSCICLLTRIYFNDNTPSSTRYVQYDNIIKLIKTINYEKYDIYVMVNLQNSSNTQQIQKFHSYFHEVVPNITIIPFTYNDLMNLYPSSKSFKALSDKKYVGICNLPLFNLYEIYNNYKSYIFWEDDLVSTFDNFIYDDIDDKYDIVLFGDIVHSPNWYWRKIQRRHLGKYERPNGANQLYCTYRFSNQVLKNLINIISKENIYGHHEDIYSSIIDYWMEQNIYNVTSLDQLFGDKKQCSHDYNKLKPQLVEYYKIHKSYKNLIIHPIKTIEIYQRILTDKNLNLSL